MPEFAHRYLGRSLYVRSGLKSYVERLNGMPDAEVGWEFAEQRLSAIRYYGPVWQLRRALVRSYQRAVTKHGPTLVRPATGFQTVYARIREELERHGVRNRALVSLFYRGRLSCGGATELYNFTHCGMWKRLAVHSQYYGRAEGDDYFAVEVTVDRGTEAAIRGPAPTSRVT